MPTNSNASVSTQSFQATPAKVQSDASSLAALGNSLGNFFGTATRAVESYGDTMHRAELVEVERENAALRKQAIIDEKNGDMNPEHANRNDYYQTFQNAAADRQANELKPLFMKRMEEAQADAARSGAMLEPRKVAEDFWKEHVASGTGDRDFDSRMILSFSRFAEPMVGQVEEHQMQQANTKIRMGVLENVANQIQSSDGMTAGKLAIHLEDIRAATGGDAKQAQDLTMSLAAGVQNYRQGTALLNSMQELGLDKAQPVMFQQIQERIWSQMTRAKTVDAHVAVEAYHGEMALRRSQRLHGVLTPEDVAEFASKWVALDSRHGLGMEQSGLIEAMSRGVTAKVDTNMVTLAEQNQLGTTSLAEVASVNGKTAGEALRHGFDGNMALKVASGRLPAMQAAMNVNTQIVDITANDEAMREFASQYHNPASANAFQYNVSDAYRSKFTWALTAGEPAQAAIAVRGLKLIESSPYMGESKINNFLTDDSKRIYWAAKAATEGGGDIQTAIRAAREYKPVADEIMSGYLDGKYNLNKVIGKAESKPGEWDSKVREAITKHATELSGQSGFIWDPRVGMPSSLERKFMSGFATTALVLRGMQGGTAEIDQIVKATMDQWKGKLVAQPKANGTLAIVEDKYPGRYQTREDPFNGPGKPYSITEGYAPYFPKFTTIRNYLGKPENMLETAREDQTRVTRAILSDRWEDGVDDLALGPQLQNGLFPLVSRVRGPVAFELGEQIGLRQAKAAPKVQANWEAFGSPMGELEALRTTRETTEKLPKDPKAAVERLKALWGPGFYPTYDESTDKIVILQGARIKDDAEVAAKKVAENEVKDQADRADQERRMQSLFDLNRARERAASRRTGK